MTIWLKNSSSTIIYLITGLANNSFPILISPIVGPAVDNLFVSISPIASLIISLIVGFITCFIAGFTDSFVTHTIIKFVFYPALICIIFII